MQFCKKSSSIYEETSYKRAHAASSLHSIRNFPLCCTTRFIVIIWLSSIRISDKFPLTIQAGDTGWQIAQNHNLDFNTQLSPWNPGVSWGALQVGQQICISDPNAAETTMFQKQQNWLIPLIVVLPILFLLIAVVLFKKRRSRSYSAELENHSVPKEEAVLTPTLGNVAVVDVASPTSPTSPKYDELPTAAPESTGPESPKSSEWELITDPNTGQPYYYNKSSGATQWEVPDGV